MFRLSCCWHFDNVMFVCNRRQLNDNGTSHGADHLNQINSNFGNFDMFESIYGNFLFVFKPGY